MAVRLTKSSSQYLVRTSAPLLNYLNPYSMIASICLPSDNNDFNNIFFIGNTTTGDFDFLETNSDGTTLRIGVQLANVEGPLEAGTSITPGVWYGIAMVRASATDLRMYLNGAQDGATITYNVSSRAGATQRQEIGRYWTAYDYPDLRVANVKLYQRALTASEVLAEHSQMRPSSFTDLWAWYPMIGSTLADSVLDYSGGGRNWSSGGTPTIEDAPPTSWGAFFWIPQAEGIIVPTLSAPGVQNITATSARPKVTLTF